MAFKRTYLACTIAALCCSIPAVAEEVADLSIVERITIIGNQADTTKATGSAYVISEEELQKFEYTNVHSILRSVPGVYLREEDGNGFYPRIGIRASSSGRSDRISIMEDGVPAAMAPYANTSAYFFPNVGRMRTVEVLKGPETLLYGPQTTSGAINLLSTAIPEQHQGYVNVEAGDFSSRKIHANYGGTQGQWGYLLETYQRTTDGHQKIDRSSRPSGVDTEEYLGKLRWKSDANARFQQQLDIKYQYTQEYANVSYLGLTDEDFRANPDRRYGLSDLERMDRGRKGFSVQHQIAFTADTLLTTTYYDYETKRIYNRLNQINGIGIGASGIIRQINTGAANADFLQGILDGIDDTTHANGVRYGHNHQAFDSRGLQLELLHNFTTGSVAHELTVAARRHEDTSHNTVNGISNSVYQQINGSLVSQGDPQQAGRQRGSAEATAVWIADRISVGDWTLVPIVRFENIDTEANLVLNPTAQQLEDRNTNSINKTTAGLGVNYTINDNWTALAGIHQGFAPPGNGVVRGSKGEESTNYEAGVRFRQGALGIDAIAFFTDYDNALRNCLVANPCGTIVEGTEQSGQKEVYGLEVGLFTELYQADSFKVPFRLAYTYTNGEYTKASDVATGVQKGDVLDYTPKHIASLQLGLEGSEGWSTFIAASYTDSSCVTTTCKREDDAFLRTDSLFTVDWVASYSLSSSAEVYVKLDNLFDQQRITHRGADGARGNAGRSAAAGLRLTF